MLLAFLRVHGRNKRFGLGCMKESEDVMGAEGCIAINEEEMSEIRVLEELHDQGVPGCR